MTGEKAPSRAPVWSVSWRFLKRSRRYLPRILGTILIVFFASGSKAAQGFLIQPVIDQFANPEKAVKAPNTDTLKGRIQAIIRTHEWDLRMVAWLAIAIAVLMFAFGFLRDYLTNWLTNRMVADLRNDVAEHLAYLPLKYHHDRKSGDLVSRMTNDVNISESATNFLFDDAIIHPIMILCALAVAFYANWMLALGSLCVFPVYALVLAGLARKMRRKRKKSLEALGDMTGTMIQTFGGIKVVKAFNSEAAQVAEFKAHNESYFRKLMAALRRKGLGENINLLMMGLAGALILVGGSRMLQTGALKPGELALFALAVAFINSSVRELSKSYNRAVEASPGCERVFELLDQPRDTEHDTGEDLPKVTSVEYSGVTFSYDTVPVLEGVSFSVKPGSVVAVVGRSGAGKTTLLDLLCRFYDPVKGEIRVSGTDLRKVRRSSLLAHVAVVTQETFLFNTTIGENIRYGKRSATTAEVEGSARSAHIHDFIAGLEKGYDTPVGERGAKLSGGQKQRIAIARAILRDPSILILDEATSALDSESEQAVQAALQNLIRSERRITFVIAHRLSTIKNADRILVLDQGKLAEDGRHEDLLAKGGVYASLYRTQFTE
ncbi:MAG TPA: ABC transporter ATP-binding protein [Planctomycetota bacterium]|nr:ABC transporter ATP-binding protein [Planctomycetota bacterium]